MKQPMEAALQRLSQMRSFGSTLVALGSRRLVLVLALVVLGSLTEGIGILMLVPFLGLVFGSAPMVGGGVVDRLSGLLPQGASTGQTLAAILGIYSLLLSVRAIVAWQRDLQSLRLALDLVNSQRERLIQSIAGSSWRQIQEMQHAHIEFAMNAEVERLSIGADQLLKAMVAGLQLVFLLGLAFWLSPTLTGIAALAALAGIPILVPLLRASHAHGVEVGRYGAERQSVLRDFLSGMKLAKAYRAEKRYARDFLEVCENILQRAISFASLRLISHNAFELAAGLAAAAICFAGLQWLDTAPGVLFAMLALMTRIVGPLRQISQSVQDILTMLPAFGTISDMVRTFADASEQASTTRPAPPFEGLDVVPVDVRATGLRYTLPGGRQLLDDAELFIRAGEIAVLLGPSGSGKTTLADIIMGLATPDAGSVQVGSLSPSQFGTEGPGRHLAGYVPQDPFLFASSLRENLLWATPQASEEDLWRALAMAEAEEFVRALPMGLDTQMGDRGARLSGGERQRICLARALVGRPGLLILDEATSALDPEVETRLLRTIGNLANQTTVLLIAHRLPEGFQADRWYTLNGGKLQPS